MTENTRKDWHDMDHDELITEVRLWRARALQNRAEREKAEALAESWRLKFSNERRNLIRLRDSARAKADKLKEQLTEEGGTSE